jgi:hypothetical protein
MYLILWTPILLHMPKPLPILVRIIERPGIGFDEAMPHIGIRLGFAQNAMDDLIQPLIRLIRDMENILVAVLVPLARLVPREAKLLDIRPRLLPAPDELIVVLDFEVSRSRSTRS